MNWDMLYVFYKQKQKHNYTYAIELDFHLFTLSSLSLSPHSAGILVTIMISLVVTLYWLPPTSNKYNAES